MAAAATLMVLLKHPFCPNDSERSEYYGRHRGEGADIFFAGSDGAGEALQPRIRPSTTTRRCAVAMERRRLFHRRDVHRRLW